MLLLKKKNNQFQHKTNAFFFPPFWEEAKFSYIRRRHMVKVKSGNVLVDDDYREKYGCSNWKGGGTFLCLDLSFITCGFSPIWHLQNRTIFTWKSILKDTCYFRERKEKSFLSSKTNAISLPPSLPITCSIKWVVLLS